jgi:hypothetical protein
MIILEPFVLSVAEFQFGIFGIRKGVFLWAFLIGGCTIPVVPTKTRAGDYGWKIRHESRQLGLEKVAELREPWLGFLEQEVKNEGEVYHTSTSSCSKQIQKSK